MHAIRLLTILVTAFVVAEYYAKDLPPEKGNDPKLNKLRSLLAGEGVPPVIKSKPTDRPTTPSPKTLPEINEWFEKMLRQSKTNEEYTDEENTSKPFAWTPKNAHYYYLEENQFRADPTLTQEVEMNMSRSIREDNGDIDSLVADEVDDLQSGLANKEYRLPVSLIPANLRWLKIMKATVESQSEERMDTTNRPRQTFFYETNSTDMSDSIYGIAVLVAVISAITVSLVGLTYGLYFLSKKIKGTSEADYPAYGVTGPSDSRGDNRLAHSAHMFHYQHQKQQIIAMERGGVTENRAGSVSEPESEEEHEEGDYTVYECPGFATTGDMEVKNPMFSDDPTPATPGDCEVVHAQPVE